ncbi:creatininase family protein [Roseomonas terrae]|jgi:creatinine amidohydrolase|uniref:Creatininase family protein n=1 Tax=Neoroseomonas terrae TaxID=424799 RepID=A0ABS5EH29_9PROT|nr:creatininase family protein [Neoroseomonas terrae]MBR0650331.1 creatininase family protein [Neoroseomonas terrae]
MSFRRAILRGAIAATVLAPAAGRTQGVPDSLDIADMTWIELRDAVAAGRRTAIVPSGGVEQNGPHMILGKHDHIVRVAARRIAAELGDALVTPVLSFSPQGRFDPPEGNLRFPGTIGVTDDAFAAMLDGIARSLKMSGFRLICFLADNGPSQRVQERLATRLSAEWRRDGVRVMAVDRYYAAIAVQDEWLRVQGETEASIGTHAGIGDTAELMSVHPSGVDLSRLPPRTDALPPLGATGDPSRASAARGETILAMRIAAAVAQIRAAQGR